MSDQSREQKIAELNKRLDELREVYARDVKASHHEPGQTKAMIDLYERQLQQLMENDGSSEILAEVELEHEQERVNYTVVSQNPNPLERKISAESEIGQKLLAAEIGDLITIAGKEYTLVEK